MMANSQGSTNLGQDPPGQAGTGPTIRHIPIHVEGRDAPIINKNFPEPTTNPIRATGSGSHLHSNNHPYQQHGSSSNIPTTTSSSSPQPPQSSGGGPNSIFSRVKNFPVRSGFDNEFFQGHHHGNNFAQRANSPGRTIPVNVSQQEARRSASPAAPQVHRPYSAAAAAAANAATARAAAAAQQQQQYQNNNATSQAHDVPDASVGGAAATVTASSEGQGGGRFVADDSIEKIHNIQRDVLALMDQVEQFRGTSKRDKQYLYLDEMLTQNLLKLDTIDTEGKENIKQARREAIKCINKCISVLEAKTEAGGGQ